MLASVGVGIVLSTTFNAAMGAELSGNTNKPEMSTFAVGEKVELIFRVKGDVKAGAKLFVKTLNERDEKIWEKTLDVNASKGKNNELKLYPPCARMGFYRVFAKLSTGETLPAMGSRKSGYLTYCVVPPPGDRKLYPPAETHFGMQGGFSDKVNVAPYLGIRWIIGGYRWKNMEPNRPGEFVPGGKTPFPSPINHVTIDGEKRPWIQYRIVTPYNGQPKWAVNLPGGHVGILKPDTKKYWASYCEAMARDYRGRTPKLEHRYYQLTWEPNFPWAFKGTDEQLIEIYKIAYPAIHKADPGAVVLGVTLSGSCTEQGLEHHKRLFKLGLGKYIDALSVHAYSRRTEEMIQQFRDLKDIMRTYAGREFPIYVTEQSYKTNEDPKNELAQARGMVQANLISLGEGIPVNITFYITDYFTEPGYGYYYNLHPKRVFGTSKTSPKPIAPAYAALTWLLEGHTATRSVEWLGDTTLGYVYERGADMVVALWDYSGQPKKINLPVGVAEVAVYDWMGNARKVPTDNGRLKLTLSAEPVYIKGASPEIWGAGAKALIGVKIKQLDVFPGDTSLLRVSIGDLRRYPGAKLRLEADDGLGMKMSNPFTAEKGEMVIKLPIAKRAVCGLYPLKIVLEDKAEDAVAATGLMIKVNPPVKVSGLRPAFSAQKAPAIQLKLDNSTDKDEAVTVAARIKGLPGAKSETTLTLKSGAGENIEIPLPGARPDPTRKYKLNLTVSTKSGFRRETDVKVNFTPAVYMNGAPKIDADLSDWPAAARNLRVKGRRYLVRSPRFYDGSEDSNAIMKFAWTEQGLLVGVQAYDDKFRQDFTGFNIWRGDSLQININLDPFKKYVVTGNDVADAGERRRVTEINTALTSKGPEAYRTVTFNRDKLNIGPIPSKDISLAVRESNDSVVYEMLIPWKTLGSENGKPPKSKALGIGIAVNDMDAKQGNKPGEQFDPSAIGLFAKSIPTDKNPDSLGVLILEEERAGDGRKR